MTQIYKDEIVVPVCELSFQKEADLSAIQEGKKVTVSAISRSLGFQGVVKRHGFHGGPKTHGQKRSLRAPGSIGSTNMQRVAKGRKMAGRMGGVRITTKGLLVVSVDNDKKIVLLRGSVPGYKSGKVEVRI